MSLDDWLQAVLEKLEAGCKIGMESYGGAVIRPLHFPD